MRKKINKARFSSHGLPAFAWRKQLAYIVHDVLVAEYRGRETPRYLSHYAALVASCSEVSIGDHYEIVAGKLLLDIDGVSKDSADWPELRPFGDDYVWVQRRHTSAALEIIDLGSRHWRYYLKGQGMQWAHPQLPESFIWEWEHLLPLGSRYLPDEALSEEVRERLIKQRSRIMPLARLIMKELKGSNPWRMR